MKQVLLYGGTLLTAGLLTYVGESWFGAEWIFGLLTVGLFILFVKGWKRWGTRVGGLVFVTAFLLFTLDSIFFVQDIPIFICSVMMGVLLMTYFHQHRDGVLASLLFVLLNMLITLEFMPNELMFWLIVLLTGAAAVIGFHFKFPLLKGCSIVLFALSAFFLLLFQLGDGSYSLSALAVLTIGFFIVYMVRSNSRAAA